MSDSPTTLVLYTTAGCHLCEQAQRLIEEQVTPGDPRWQLELSDIAEDALLMERYGIRIPVLQRADNGEELGWPFDGSALAAFLADA
ncbi:MAG: glutaredoxin family protein [Pseudohongiellaceae bacterium]